MTAATTTTTRTMGDSNARIGTQPAENTRLEYDAKAPKGEEWSDSTCAPEPDWDGIANRLNDSGYYELLDTTYEYAVASGHKLAIDLE